MDIEKIVGDVAETIQKEANVRAIFGEPTQIDERKVVPVGRVTVSISGGAGTGAGESKGEERGNGVGGGGGAVNVTVTPVGFIAEGPEGVVFTPIDHTPDGVLGRLEHLLKSTIRREKETAHKG